MGRLEMTCEEYAELKSNDPQNAMLRVVAKAAGWQQCPRCKHMTERSAGCKFMVCRCRASFCYLCGVELTAAQHCSHYRGPGE
jgi:E3 ubiquitin-protein ligase RNF144